MSASDREGLRALQAGRDWIWIAGNHDPAPPPEGWGEVAEEIDDAPLVFRHEAQFGPVAGEVSGHFHPVAALTVRGRGLRRRLRVLLVRARLLPELPAAPKSTPWKSRWTCPRRPAWPISPSSWPPA